MYYKTVVKITNDFYLLTMRNKLEHETRMIDPKHKQA